MSELDPIPPVTDRLEIALRAYVESAGRSSISSGWRPRDVKRR